MTDTTPTEPIDEATAQAQLNALEAAAVNGEPVAAAQLAEARERVTLAGLWAKGKAMREAARQRREAEERRAAAKVQVAEMLKDNAAARDGAAQNVIQAVAALIAVIAENNAEVAEASAIFARAGVVNPSPWGREDPMDVPDIDRDNYAWIEQGMRLTSVQAGGISYPVWRTNDVVGEVLTKAIHDNDLGDRISYSDHQIRIG